MPDKTDYSNLANLETSQALSHWREQKNYVIDNQVSIRKQYGTDYIAVKDKKVVDHDSDEFTLAKRMNARFKKSFVLISTIEKFLQ